MFKIPFILAAIWTVTLVYGSVRVAPGSVLGPGVMIPAAASSVSPRISSVPEVVSHSMNGYSWLRCLLTVSNLPPTSRRYVI